MNSRTNMLRGRAFYHLTAALMLCAASTGCSQQGTGGAPEVGELEVVRLTESAADDHAPGLVPFATIKLDSGRRVEFIDLGDGDIGVSEVGSTGGVSVVGELTRKWDATPLEVFLALAGDRQQPPALLVKAHVALATRDGHAASARQLPGEQNLVPTGVSAYPAGKCGLWLGTSWSWVQDWTNTYGNTRDVVAAKVLMDVDASAPLSFYAGSKPVTAANMAVCVDDHWYYPYNSATDKVRFKVFAKTSGSASGCGGATWGSALYNVVVDQDESANFYTSSFTGKLVCSTVVAYDASTDTRDLGMATAYNLPLGIGG